MAIQKSYLYKIYDSSGNYLGLLPNSQIQSEFSFNQNINTAGTQISITVQVDADTAGQPASPIQDELGNNVLDETGATIYDEGVGDIVGEKQEQNLMQNGNKIVVVEFSSYTPNGRTKFSGFISKWKPNFAANQVILTCISNGQDLSQFLISGGYTLQTQDLITSGTFSLYSATAGQPLAFAQYFVPVTNYSLGKISVRMAIKSGSTAPVTVYCSLFSGFPGAGTPMADTTVQITNTTQQYIDFVFTTPQALVAGGDYWFYVEPFNAQNIDVSVDNAMNLGQGYYFLNTAWFNTTNSLTCKIYSSTSSTTLGYTNTDPTDMLVAVMNDYVARGGLVALDTAVAETGTLLTYSFKSNSILEAVQAVVSMAPADWFWYVDPGTNTLYFAAKPGTASFVLVKGRHIQELEIERTSEQIFNSIYFTGGDDGTGTGTNIFVHVTDTTSIASFGNRMARISDNRVNSTSGGTTTATTIASNYLDNHLLQQYIATCVIPDGVMDISSITLGQTINFSGWGNFIDALGLQVVGIDYHPDYVKLNLGILPLRASGAVEDIYRQLTYLQTVDNPATPS